MSLETEIKKLREAIEANTLAALECVRISEEYANPREGIKQAIQKAEMTQDVDTRTLKDVIAEVEENKEELTIETVRDFAQEKIESGADRAVIKDMIKFLGASSMSDLNAENLTKLHEQLKTL